MTRGQAAGAMVAVTLMWSIAGVVTRQLDSARSFEATFWRSLFNALALLLMLIRLRGRAALVGSFRHAGATLWVSAVCWSVMFTAFMVALTLTSVANVLVTMALAPLVTALLARVALGQRLAMRTWTAIAVAACGIAWMYGGELRTAGSRSLFGTLVALGVPIAAAVNWTLIQASARRSLKAAARAPDGLLSAVLAGAVLSAVATLPAALPFAASARDLAWLALLGVVQLAVPCLLAVACAKVLSAPEVALLALLEVVFGVLWAWVGAGETPSSNVLVGGMLVLGALALNEALSMRRATGALP